MSIYLRSILCKRCLNRPQGISGVIAVTFASSPRKVSLRRVSGIASWYMPWRYRWWLAGQEGWCRVTHEIDHLVGRRIRQRRWFAGLTQQELAESVGVKFQQIQKYETGANRVSASRLWMIGESLEVPVSYFFADDACTPAPRGQKWQPELPPKDLMLLAKLFSRLSSDQKEALLGLAKTMTI